MRDSLSGPWWTSVSRTVLINRGAQANAAEELTRTRRTRTARAEAAAALQQAQAAVEARRPGEAP